MKYCTDRNRMRDVQPSNSPDTGSDADANYCDRITYLSNRELGIGVLIYLALLIPVYLFHVPCFSGEWTGIFASSTCNFNFNAFVLLFGGGISIAYLVLCRNNAVLDADLPVRAWVLGGIVPLTAGYVTIFIASLVFETLMPFPPFPPWVVLQAGLVFVAFVGVRMYLSRWHSLPLLWIPGLKTVLLFVGIICFGLLVIFI